MIYLNSARYKAVNFEVTSEDERRASEALEGFKDETFNSLTDSGALVKKFYASPTPDSALGILDSTLGHTSRPPTMAQSVPSTNLKITGFGNLNVSSTKYRIKASSIFSGMFSHSSKNIWVDEYAMLHADCERRAGDAHNHSTLRLNDFIGNDNGYFTTEYGGIVASALSFKIAEDGHTLTAEVRDLVDDSYNIRKLDLDTCVANTDGRLVFCANHSGHQ